MASKPSLNPTRQGAAPGRKVLLGLTAVVLASHWWALGGHVDLWPDQWFKPASELGPLPTMAPTSAEMPALNAALPLPEAPKPVTVATVRWISPPPPPEPEPAPPPATPVKIAKPKATPPPEPVIETLVPEPEPAPEAAEVLPPDPIETPLPEPVAEPAIAAEATPAPTETPEVITLPSESDSPELAEGTPEQAVVLAPNAKLSYSGKAKVKGVSWNGGGALDWQQDGSTYQAKLTVTVLGIEVLVHTSTGLVTPLGLEPERFSVEKARKSEKAAHFDKATGRIRYSSNAPDAPLLAGAQDQLSVTLQLASLLNTYKDMGGARTVSIPVSTESGSEPWRFEVGSLAMLRLPAGEVMARELTRAPRRDHDKTVQLWMAPDLGHLPVRIRITETNGDYLDLSLDDLPEIALPTPDRPEDQP